MIYKKSDQLKSNKPKKFKGGSISKYGSYFWWLRTYKPECIICCDTADIHHIDFAEGWNIKHDDRVVMLCHHHHQGVDGIHTIGANSWYAKFKTFEELEFIANKNFKQWREWSGENFIGI